MFEQKQNNPMLNTQEEIAKLNRSKQRQSSVVPEGAGAGADVDMIAENEAAESQVGLETPSKKRNRADFEKSQQQIAEQLVKEEKSEQKDHDESV